MSLYITKGKIYIKPTLTERATLYIESPRLESYYTTNRAYTTIEPGQTTIQLPPTLTGSDITKAWIL